MTLNSSLLQWLATFELDGQPSVELKDDAYYNLADGYVCARILNQICPIYFNDVWLQGIKPVPPNGSWRFRVSNLKRILKKIYDYASDLQSLQFKPSAITPDVAVIAQNFDADHISRLIQLILFCTINCERKQDYIEKIRDLPTQVKQDIKEAIEQLLVSNTEDVNSQKQINTSQSTDDSLKISDCAIKTGHNVSNNSNASPARNLSNRSLVSRRNSSQSDASNLDTDKNETVEELRQKLSIALSMKDEKSQACYELEKKLKQIQFERDQFAYENEKLLISRSTLKDNVGISKADNLVRNFDNDKPKDFIIEQNAKLQLELSKLKEEVIKLESEKEDFRLKSNLLKEDLDKVTSKQEELRTKADQVKRLQDELDEHKHMSEKVINFEATIDNLVKKNNDLKRELKCSEEKNVSYIQNIVKLEQEKSHLSNVINQFDIYKRQLSEAQAKLSQETHRAEKVEVELARLREKLTVSERENELLHETARATKHVTQIKDDHAPAYSGGDEILQSLSADHLIELKEKVARLSIENELLQTKLDRKFTDNSPFGGLVEATSDRCTKLEIENKQARKRIQVLEGRLKDLATSNVSQMHQHGIGPSTSTAMTGPEDSSSDNVIALMNRVEELQQMLFQKKQELMESEQKYKKNIQKAKEVFQVLRENQAMGSGSFHPSYVSSTSPFNSTTSLDEVNALKQQLHEREARIIEIEREFYEFKKIKEVHERLILSAFYALTTPMQWKNAASRLDRTSLTSPPNTANNSIRSNSKHSH